MLVRYLKNLSCQRAIFTIMLLTATGAAQPGFCADGIQLQPMAPQEDKTPTDTVPAPDGSQLNSNEIQPNLNGNPPGVGINGDAGTNNAPSKFHKLGVSKRELRDEINDGNTNFQDELPVQQAQRPRAIIINSTVIHLNGRTNTTDSFTLMNALMGVRSRDIAKLYAERDTGYGVCGFLMNMPIGRRGYAKVLRCFPSMPAAQAGISPGDFIVAVDGKSTLELPPKEVWDYFTGMPGTEVSVDLLHGRQPYTVTLKRMDIGRIPDIETRAEFLSLYQQNGMSKFLQQR